MRSRNYNGRSEGRGAEEGRRGKARIGLSFRPLELTTPFFLQAAPNAGLGRHSKVGTRLIPLRNWGQKQASSGAQPSSASAAGRRWKGRQAGPLQRCPPT